MPTPDATPGEPPPTSPSSPPPPSGSGSLATVSGFILGGATLVEALPRAFEEGQPTWLRIAALALSAGVVFHPSVSIALIDKVAGLVPGLRGGGR